MNENIDLSSNKIKTFICGSVINCAPYLHNIFANILSILSLFEDFHIIMSVDPCSDNTMNILIDYKKKYGNKMDILYNTNPLSNIRVERINNSRNRILNQIRRLNKDFSHFIMLDCDDVCATKIKPEVLSKYLNRGDWDSLSFNRKDYYDIWALSFQPYMFSCWNFPNAHEVVKNTRIEIKNQLANIDQDDLLSCYSAFNGFAIYKISKFLNCDYSWIIDYSYFSQVMIDENIKYTKTMPFKRVPDQDCEHRAFHFQAIRKNHAKIRISPLYLFE